MDSKSSKKHLKMAGFIQLHKKLIKWEWYSNIPVRLTFIHLLLIANWEDKNWQGITIKRGQALLGTIDTPKEIGISRQQFRTALNKLKSTNEITTKSTNKNTLVTIVKYDEYQDVKTKLTNTITNNTTNNQPTNNQQITTTNNNNNNNNYNNYNNTLLSEIEISDFDDRFQNFIKTAISFQKLFIKNLKEKNSPTKKIEKSTFKNYVTPIRLMIETDEVTSQQFRTVYDFLNSAKGEWWKSNILSIKKLREKLPELILKANTSNGTSTGTIKKAATYDRDKAIANIQKQYNPSV